MFDADMQDMLAIELLNERGLKNDRSGRITAQPFQVQLAQQWASVAFVATGKAKQHTGMTTAQIREAKRYSFAEDVTR